MIPSLSLDTRDEWQPICCLWITNTSLYHIFVSGKEPLSSNMWTEYQQWHRQHKRHNLQLGNIETSNGRNGKIWTQSVSICAVQMYGWVLLILYIRCLHKYCKRTGASSVKQNQHTPDRERGRNRDRQRASEETLCIPVKFTPKKIRDPL
jgi:hypothetical protein